MTTQKTDETDEKEEPKDEKASADKTVGDGGSDAGGIDDRIRELVRQAVESLVGPGEKIRRSPVDDEEHLFQLVKKAQEKIKADEEKEGRFKTVEETVQKLVEKPPARDGIGGKIQRWMWGGE